MEFVRGNVNFRPRHRGCVLTIGAFDGLHLGHQALIRRTLELAGRTARRSMLMTFEPLPREVLTRPPAVAPARLTNFRERWRLLDAMGIDTLMVLHFNTRLRQMRGEEFAAWLSRELQAYTLVVGHDFRFGRNGEMSAGMLEEAGRRLGFGVEIIPPVTESGDRVSSSGLRAALIAADFNRAADLLGRPYRMRGRVVHGKKLGRTLGFPTANVRLRRRQSPFTGIYAVRALGVGATALPGVASLGTRPTVGGGELLLETTIFDFNGDLYGRELEIEFVAKLREELRFASVDELVVQMRRDSDEARAILYQ